MLQVNLSSCQRIVLLNYDKETKLIDFRHYSIRLQPVGVSGRIRKFVQNHQVPDLRNLQDVSDFVTKYVSVPRLSFLLFSFSSLMDMIRAGNVRMELTWRIFLPCFTVSAAYVTW